MLPTEDDCDECTAKTTSERASSLPIALLPFIVTFAAVATLSLRRIYPLLSNRAADGETEQQLPTHVGRDSDRKSGKPRSKSLSAEPLVAATFSSNIALSAVLVELILCEISNVVNPAAREFALKSTLFFLLFLLVLATPALELRSLIHSAGWRFGGAGRAHCRTAWLLEVVGLGAWLVGFWYLGRGLLGSYLHEPSYERTHSISEGCLERIGVVGISLMASLAGFAAISSIWQTFGVKAKMVTDSDIARKQTGLDATAEMLQAKRSRLRALQRRMSDAAPEGFISRMVGSIRGSSDTQEQKALQLEISGLEAMQTSLSNSLVSMKSRRQAQMRSKTASGRLVNGFSYAFAMYCFYRLSATSFAAVRRFRSPSTNFSNTDPINNFLAVVAKHWDPSLDRHAWSRQISFLLSGVMLLASFNSVLQTFLLFARVAPGVIRHAQANMALLVSQVSATYVISSALLLRSNLPREVSSVISNAIGAPLEPVFVEKWFEGWFLAVAALTAAGLWVGKKFSAGGGWDDEDESGDGDAELGKRS